MEELAQKYVDFQNEANDMDEAQDEAIDRLFSPNFKRTINGRIVVSSRENLASQLQQMRTHFGKRQLKLQQVISCADQEQCLVRYFLDVETMGQFDVMAILKSKSGTSIDEVDEIYYKIN